ncbi:MAG TPA: hypothetical protein VJ547_12250 [Candidatus Thermoplasmatota archaeon]|nr:hypothetical protein [Candidatus Thermoplasmatota archaeon]
MTFYIIAGIAIVLTACLAEDIGKVLFDGLHRWWRIRRACKTINRIVSEEEKNLPPLPEKMHAPSLWYNGPDVTPEFPEIVVACAPDDLFTNSRGVTHFKGCYCVYTPDYPEACSCPAPYGKHSLPCPYQPPPEPPCPHDHVDPDWADKEFDRMA